MPNLISLVKPYKRNYEDPPEKFALASFLSRSLKIIGTSTDRSATYDFSLAINSNHGPGPISYRYRDKRKILSKVAIFPTSMYLTPPLREFPFEFCNGSSVRKI